MPAQQNIRSSPASESKSLNLKCVGGGSALIGIFVVISNSYFDPDIARFFRSMLGANAWLARHTSHIPDILFPVVLAITALTWLSYFFLRNKTRYISLRRLCQLMGTTVPISVLLAFVLKHIFGRVNTQAWLFNPDLYAYQWFQGGPHYIGFPSGHMAVITALVAAAWHYSPRYRKVYSVALLFTAFMLITSTYHFLSDVIAGAYLGLMVDYLAYQCMIWGRKSI
jgi:membrane-associated phospholipid phosphatase